LPRSGYVGNEQWHIEYRKAVVSIPNVSLIPVDVMFLKKATKLILETNPAMVMLLFLNVPLDPLEAGNAY
jgi:hypothetical protein